MDKLTKIKFLFTKPPIANLPKYLALFGLIHSAILPVGALSWDNQSGRLEKPVLLALADARPLISSPNQPSKDQCLLMLTQGTTLIGQTNPNFDWQSDCQNPKQKIVSVKKRVVVTAYSSTPDQTDSTPFITAMGTHVRDGVIACNFLRFGTKIRLPQIYGDKIFVVEDRMARWNSHKIDIWMSSKTQAKEFGVKRLTLEILEQ